MKQKENFKNAQLVVNHFAQAVQRGYRCTVRYQRLAAVDDDVFSAYVAAHYYHGIKADFGYYPKVDCIGGLGLMSGKINPKKDGKRLSEAEMLRYVLIRLGVREDDIAIVSSVGTNTGANLAHYAKCLRDISAEQEPLLFCLTKRLVGRFYLTQIKQQPQLDADYVWLEAENECQFYNGKAFAGGLPYLSEAASIYDRYLRYADPVDGSPVFMAHLPERMPFEVVDAGDWLREHYKLKIPEFSLLKIWQYVQTFASFWVQKRKCLHNLNENIYDWQRELMYRYALVREFKTDKVLGGTESFLTTQDTIIVITR